MTPDEFLRSIEKREPQPAYLFLDPEGWSRDRCRNALIERVLPPRRSRTGLTRHDLSEVEFERCHRRCSVVFVVCDRGA